MTHIRERRGLTSLLVGVLIFGLGAFGTIKEMPLEKKIINSNYEIPGRGYGENWKYYIGLEALGASIMIGSYFHLRKRLN
ncbi:MAG: hypothetical protein AABY15_03470 [Nanoarchaeota archaeon]